MDGLSDVILSIPLYVPLPHDPGVAEKQYVLINASLERVGAKHVRMKTEWTVTRSTLPWRGHATSPALLAPTVPGVTVFMPQNPLENPIYMFVNNIEGRRIQPGLLIAVSIYQWRWGTCDGLNVDAVVVANADRQLEYSKEICLDSVQPEEDDMFWVSTFGSMNRGPLQASDAADGNGGSSSSAARAARKQGRQEDGMEEVVVDDGKLQESHVKDGSGMPESAEVGRCGVEARSTAGNDRAVPLVGDSERRANVHCIDDMYA